MNTIRNKGCFSNLSRALLAFEFLLVCLPLLPLLSPAVLFFPWEKNGGGFNIFIVIVLSVFELKTKLLLTCKYFRLNWAK